MKHGARLWLVVAAVPLLSGRDLPERFRRELFPNEMQALSQSEREITQALLDFEETNGCEYDGLMRGSFTSRNAREAIVTARCGEAHADNYGSTILLSNQSGHWKALWREAGLITRYCSRLSFNDGRDGVFCKDFYSHMGWREQYLYSIDFSRPPKQRQVEILSTADSLWSGYDQATEANIERLEITPSTLAVWVRYGVAVLPQNVREENLVSDQEPAPIATKVYRLEFLFKRTGFEPTQSSSEQLRQFRLNSTYR